MWHTLCNLNKFNFIFLVYTKKAKLSISTCICLIKIQIAVKISHGVRPSRNENPVLTRGYLRK